MIRNFYDILLREAIKKKVSVKNFTLKVGGGQFESLIFLKLKIRKFLPGRGSESNCPYFLLNFKSSF